MKKGKSRAPDAGRVVAAILSQMPPDDLGRYTLLAASRVDDGDLADDLYALASDPADTGRRLLESVTLSLTYCDLLP